MIFIISNTILGKQNEFSENLIIMNLERGPEQTLMIPIIDMKNLFFSCEIILHRKIMLNHLAVIIFDHKSVK